MNMTIEFFLLLQPRNLSPTENKQREKTKCHSPRKYHCCCVHCVHHHRLSSSHLTVSPVALGVVALPGLPSAGVGLGVAVALVDTTGLLAGGSETTGFAVLYTLVFILSSLT
jgi:hypothetical protein